MKSFKKGDTIQVWDFMSMGEYRFDSLKAHGKIGLVIRPAKESDVGDDGYTLEKKAKSCYLIAVPSLGLVNIHREWLRYPE